MIGHGGSRGKQRGRGGSLREFVIIGSVGELWVNVVCRGQNSRLSRNRAREVCLWMALGDRGGEMSYGIGECCLVERQRSKLFGGVPSNCHLLGQLAGGPFLAGFLCVLRRGDVEGRISGRLQEEWGWLLGLKLGVFEVRGEGCMFEGLR